jgi:hypothetical protein
MEDCRVTKQTWQYCPQGNRSLGYQKQNNEPDLGVRTDKQYPNHVDDDDEPLEFKIVLINKFLS